MIKSLYEYIIELINKMLYKNYIEIYFIVLILLS